MGTPARIILSVALTGLLGGTADVAAQQAGQAQPQQGMREHIVRKGETLWGLAGFYFTNPFLWPVIYDANRDVVEDPHWIYPDERLRIPTLEQGLPVVVREQQPGEVQPEADPQPRGPSMANVPGRSRFYQPPPVVDPERATTLMLRREPLSAVPPAEYFSAAWLADSSTSGIRARLLGVADPKTHADKLPQYLHPYDRVLFSWLRDEPVQVGDQMMVVSFGEKVALHGVMVLPVALVRIDSVGASVVSAQVMHQYGGAKTGDYLIPMDPQPQIGRGEPQPVSNGAEGILIAFTERDQLYGTMDNGFIDLGADAGVAIGDELLVYLPARPGVLKSMQLPSEAVAKLQVVKVRANSSTVRVLDALNTTLRSGLPVRVVRKMH